MSESEDSGINTSEVIEFEAKEEDPEDLFCDTNLAAVSSEDWSEIGSSPTSQESGTRRPVTRSRAATALREESNSRSSDDSSEEDQDTTSTEEKADKDTSDEEEDTEEEEDSTTMSTKTIKIAGLDIAVNDKPNAGTNQASPMYPKEKREKLSEEKRMELFRYATQSCVSPKFELMNLSIQDTSSLDETCALNIQLIKLEAQLIKYDMTDVFTILTYDEADNMVVTKEQNLLKDYATITIDDVAKSNAWYQKWPEADTFRENLQLSADLLQNNMEDSLWEKCLETYNAYKPEEQGGPLLFIIMMNHLQSNTEEAVEYLQNALKKIQIRDYEGENVEHVVSLIRGAYRRLKNLGPHDSKVPKELPKQLVEIFQTSSVSDFNDVFKHIALDSKTKTTKGKLGTGKWPPVEETLELAAKTYLDLWSTDQWSGVTTKAKESSFIADQGKKAATDVVCWNCDEQGHTTKTCPRPKNNDLIKKNRAVFLKNRRANRQQSAKDKAKATKGKWAPPTNNENNRRTIDGKAKFWLKPGKKWPNGRWVDDRDAPSAQVVTPPATGPPSTITATVPAPGASVAGTTTDAAKQQRRELALSNTTHAIQTAMQGLLSALDE